MTTHIVGRERGATLVEYALGAALFALVALAGVSVLERQSGEALEDRASIVEAPDQYGFIGASAGAPPTFAPPDDEGGEGGTTPVLVESVTVDTDSGIVAGNPPNRWFATAEFIIGGSSADGVVFRGTWSGVGGGASTETSCLTAQGACSVVATGMNTNNTASVMFLLTEIAGDGVTVGDGVELPQEFEFTRP